MDSPKLKNSLAVCLFAIQLTISCGYPVPSLSTDGIDFQYTIHNVTDTGGSPHEGGATNESFPMDQSAFNITISSNDPSFLTSNQTDELLTTDIPDLVEITTPFPINEEEVTILEDHPSKLEDLFLDSDAVPMLPSTDVPVDLQFLASTEESVTPSVPQDVLMMSVSTSPPDLSLTSAPLGEPELRDLSSTDKMLHDQEAVSKIVGNYVIPPEDVKSSGYIPTTSTASPDTFAPDVVAKHVPTLSTKTSVDEAIHLQTAIRKLVDMNPFLLNPSWPAEMGFHSIPEQHVTQSFGNQRSMFHTKPYRRVLPEFQLDPPLYSGMRHNVMRQVHPVQYRQPVSHGHPHALYSHHHNNAIHRSFESANPKSRMFAFPGISSTRENFRFRVNWIDEIAPAGPA